MERQKGLKLNKITIAILIIVVFHIVGLIGFFIPALQPLFLKIVPFHLLLMLAVIIYSHEARSFKFLIFFIVVFVLGLLVEWVGVHEHVIFGRYVYGKTLGIKLSDIPLMIGVNWFLLVYSAGVLVQWSPFKNPFIKVVLGAAVLVLLDMVIEPVAVRFDYWAWLSAGSYLTAPLKNYVDWFLVSLAMLVVFELFQFKKQSQVAAVLMLTQFVFFILMRWA
ncbi:carotenoid biosynthesis protein [Mucilaginibacter paludis]|uniref:Carotenoid biosynthesis protein n=1 Tax=Mucilaginibacter paludis DSM 18603 TaxID=714943 RepID=H1YGL6_9SPHI|nr:carotenoid biosynthesis protein [Mucilaginibacter paludis]EHQ25402.1 protein of unknown function DUF422 [Mucilaginibacter paludis DSM 18603]